MFGPALVGPDGFEHAEDAAEDLITSGGPKWEEASVRSVVVTERWPEYNAIWLRAEIRWTDDVLLLLDAGLLQPRPPALGPTEERREAERARRQNRAAR